MNPPSPHQRYPIQGYDGVVFLSQVVKSPRIQVGDYTYFDDPVAPETFEEQNVLYHFDFIGDSLKIGKFCSIARGVRFIMNGAMILPGAQIGDGAIIGACAVATKDVAPDAVVGGIVAKRIRCRFDEAIIALPPAPSLVGLDY